MKQTSNITKALAQAQENHAAQSGVIFRLYTEDRDNLLTLVSRYFEGATLINAQGLWKGQLELSKVIEIVGTLSQLQDVVHLAGDICEVNNQETVLVTWSRGQSLLVERQPAPQSSESHCDCARHKAYQSHESAR